MRVEPLAPDSAEDFIKELDALFLRGRFENIRSISEGR